MTNHRRGEEDGLERLVAGEQRPNDEIHDQLHHSLSTPLRVLFALNGVSLSLPSTALLYIVNTRVSVPLSYLSAYGAVAFLPFSLKPVYAFLSTCLGQRSTVLVVLLGLNGLATASTALVPSGGVVECFVLAFLRGVTNAWPEFLLGLTLIDEAQCCQRPFASTAALFQSQAATARNLGSLVANVVAVAMFIRQHLWQVTNGQQELSDTIVDFLLVFTGMITCLGAAVAWFSQVARTRIVPGRYTILSNTGNTEDRPSSSSSPDVVLLVLLQILIALIAARGLIEDAASSWIWRAIALSCFLTLMIIFCLSCGNWTRRRRVGLFLIAKHAVPTATYTMQSYVYELFQSSPLSIQLFRLVAMGTTTLSSWSYGTLLSKYSSGWNFLLVLSGTMVLAAACSIANILLVGLDTTTSASLWKAYAVASFIHIVTTFVEEWRFLPSVVLATTSVSTAARMSTGGGENCLLSIAETQPHEQQIQHDIEDGSTTSTAQIETNQDSVPGRTSCGDVVSTEMQYGTLVSCIDFGGQIGSWLTVPLVSALGMSRENGWQHLDSFIVITAVLGLLPILLISLLRNQQAS